VNTDVKHIIYNGEVVETQQHKIALSNRSFRYGDGIFETVRIFNGRPVFVDDHIVRLKNGMQVLNLNFDNGSFPAFGEMISSLAAVDNIKGGFARINVYRSGSGKFMPLTNSADFIIEVHNLENEYFLPKEKLIIGVYPEILKPVNSLAAVKSNNSLLYVLASVYARNNGFGDALILNENKRIIEATSSNLFVISGKRAVTPPLSAGPLPGIMRMQIMKILLEEGFELEEKCPDEKMLLNAGEVFLTNAVAGVRPVTGFKSKRYFKTVSQKMLERLNTMVNVV
jgi:branched-chain amino acid aminotransferase